MRIEITNYIDFINVTGLSAIRAHNTIRTLTLFWC